MVLKCAAIEAKRSHPNAVIIGLHPGTVDSDLSKPFQRNVAKLFTPEYSASRLLAVATGLTPADSGNCFDWNNQRIEP